MDKIVFPDLSYKIIGATFKVYNELGWGLQEKYYQKALAAELDNQQIKFNEQVLIPLKYGQKDIGRYFVDFVVENKVVLELKVVNKSGYSHSRQVLGYLKSSGIKLGILIYFTKEGVKYRRVLNSDV